MPLIIISKNLGRPFDASLKSQNYNIKCNVNELKLSVNVFHLKTYFHLFFSQKLATHYYTPRNELRRV